MNTRLPIAFLAVGFLAGWCWFANWPASLMIVLAALAICHLNRATQ